MKYLKRIKKYFNELEIKKICNKFNIKNWTLNSDGTIDVNDDIHLTDWSLNLSPLKFGRVEGTFICYYNNLTSLEGCPNYISEWFECSWNNLTSLEGCPKYVGGDFYCNNNNIINFEGVGYIGGYFYCSDNPIYPLWRLFRDVSKIDQFNEWSIIQGNNVILYRLNDFLENIGKGEVTDMELEQIEKCYNVI